MNTKKILLLFAIIALQLFAITSCNLAGKAKLKLAVESANEECPLELIDGQCSITNFSLDGNTVVINYRCSDSYISLIQSQDKEYVRNNILSTLALRTDQEFIDMISEAQAAITLKFNNKDNKEIFTFEFSPEDIKETRRLAATGELQPSSFLDMIRMEMKQFQETLPVEIDSNIILTDYVLDGTTLVYTYEITNNYDDTYIADEKVASAKQSCIKALRTAYASQLQDIYDEGVKFRYIYKNHNGTTIYVIEIDGSDLK